MVAISAKGNALNHAFFSGSKESGIMNFVKMKNRAKWLKKQAGKKSARRKVDFSSLVEAKQLQALASSTKLVSRLTQI
jgi:hypothetical protein